MESEFKELKKFLDPSFPLLEKFRDLAPGSFRHCQAVTNIYESIAVDLELDIDLIKCAAMYHDIGKMYAPQYFSENQPQGNNPHTDLDSLTSYYIISKHVGDSVNTLLQYPDIPLKVLAVISQHHGNSVIKSFYNKSNDSPEDNFRYKCQPPTYKEAAILMIIDTCEATVRAVVSNNKDNEDSNLIEKTISETIDNLINDGQLDSMRLGTLKVVKKFLIKDLKSTHHKRVMYDEKTIGDIKNKDIDI